MVQGQVFVKGEGDWHFCYLIFSRFIIFTFRNYSTFCIIVLYICRKIIFFCQHNFMKKIRSKLPKMNLCVCVRKVGVSDKGSSRFSAWGWVELSEVPSKGWSRKEGSRNKKIKKGARQAGLRGGCHKKEKAGTPLQTMHLTQHPIKTPFYSLHFSLIFWFLFRLFCFIWRQTFCYVYHQFLSLFHLCY